MNIKKKAIIEADRIMQDIILNFCIPTYNRPGRVFAVAIPIRYIQIRECS
jgi:hypothetical protein